MPGSKFTGFQDDSEGEESFVPVQAPSTTSETLTETSTDTETASRTKNGVKQPGESNSTADAVMLDDNVGGNETSCVPIDPTTLKQHRFETINAQTNKVLEDMLAQVKGEANKDTKSWTDLSRELWTLTHNKDHFDSMVAMDVSPAKSAHLLVYKGMVMDFARLLQSVTWINAGEGSLLFKVRQAQSQLENALERAGDDCSIEVQALRKDYCLARMECHEVSANTLVSDLKHLAKLMLKNYATNVPHKEFNIFAWEKEYSKLLQEHKDRMKQNFACIETDYAGKAAEMAAESGVASVARSRLEEVLDDAYHKEIFGGK